MEKFVEGAIGTGIAGLGRSGWGIHAAGLEPLKEEFAIAAVFDRDPARLAEAKQRFGCATYEDYDSLLADRNVELVIVAMPSHLHAEFGIRALKMGKHVVAEKPMAATLGEADRMIRAARRSGKVLTVFHNHRYDPGFQKIKEVVRSGKLGRIVEIKVGSHGFGRRWDWQTLKKYGGGMLRNNGSHLIDAVLDLLGDAAETPPKVWCHLDRTLALGDADDHVKLILRLPNGPLVDIELTSACAYPQGGWLVMGTAGSLVALGKEIRWKYFDPAQLPHRDVDERPTPDRSYNQEQIPWKEETWTREGRKGPAWGGYYLDIYQTLRHGAPLVVRPEQVRRQMAIIEECMRQNPAYR